VCTRARRSGEERGKGRKEKKRKDKRKKIKDRDIPRRCIGIGRPAQTDREREFGFGGSRHTSYLRNLVTAHLSPSRTSSTGFGRGSGSGISYSRRRL
jgi:hypothetical protein